VEEKKAGGGGVRDRGMRREGGGWGRWKGGWKGVDGGE